MKPSTRRTLKKLFLNVTAGLCAIVFTGNVIAGECAGQINSVLGTATSKVVSTLEEGEEEGYARYFESQFNSVAELKAAGKDYRVLKMPAAAVPKAQVIGNPRGFYKALVDPTSHQILGATIYAEEAYETINLITLAIQHHLPAEALRDQIYTHPTMTEALNDLFGQL